MGVLLLLYSFRHVETLSWPTCLPHLVLAVLVGPGAPTESGQLQQHVHIEHSPRILLQSITSIGVTPHVLWCCFDFINIYTNCGVHVCVFGGAVRLNQNFDDLNTLLPSTNGDLQDLWNRYKAVGQTNLTRARRCKAPIRGTRSSPP